eukprot:UN28714
MNEHSVNVNDDRSTQNIMNIFTPEENVVDEKLAQEQILTPHEILKSYFYDNDDYELFKTFLNRKSGPHEDVLMVRLKGGKDNMNFEDLKRNFIGSFRNLFAEVGLITTSNMPDRDNLNLVNEQDCENHSDIMYIFWNEKYLKTINRFGLTLATTVQEYVAKPQTFVLKLEIPDDGEKDKDYNR